MHGVDKEDEGVARVWRGLKSLGRLHAFGEGYAVFEMRCKVIGLVGTVQWECVQQFGRNKGSVQMVGCGTRGMEREEGE